MTREIKFRAWDKKETKQVVELSYDQYGGIDVFISHGINAGPLGPTSLMQFTGLKDKNGKEIYEGDVVSFATENTKYNWLVSFYDGCFGFERKNQFITVGFVNHGTDELEVIGNIYENPKLGETTK